MTIPLPELTWGRHMLARMPVHEEPQGTHWQAPNYVSVTPWICEFRDVLVHTSAGIICIDDNIILDTMLQTAGSINYYDESPDGVTLRLAGEISDLRGSHLSLLSGNHNNYYHWMLDCLGRLAVIDDLEVLSCADILVPTLNHGFQSGGLELTRLPRSHKVKYVTNNSTYRVEHLIVPWSIHGHHTPHPLLTSFFDHISSISDWSSGSWPRRIYIDRRGSSNRKLLNEAAVIEALQSRDFVPVRLENITFNDQISLFRNADIVVGSHGAGLTNIIFSNPRTCLIELHMNSWVNWCFRHLASLKKISYDCVIGRQLGDRHQSSDPWVHDECWEISTTHVLGVVDKFLHE